MIVLAPLTLIDETVAVIVGIVVMLVVYYALPATRVTMPTASTGSWITSR
jgi:hypothetical protein